MCQCNNKMNNIKNLLKLKKKNLKGQFAEYKNPKQRPPVLDIWICSACHERGLVLTLDTIRL